MLDRFNRLVLCSDQGGQLHGSCRVEYIRCSRLLRERQVVAPLYMVTLFYELIIATVIMLVCALKVGRHVMLLR